MGWVAALHRHHDHSRAFRGQGGARFPETVICDQCNVADGAVKRKLMLPKNFSFAPEEIRAFVSATPHGKHIIDYQKAHALYRSI
jgi:hypothetical protein